VADSCTYISWYNCDTLPDNDKKSTHHNLLMLLIICKYYCDFVKPISRRLLRIRLYCGGVERRTDSVPDFCGSALGAMEISVFWPKYLEALTDLEDFWHHHRGFRTHPLEIF